MQKFHAPNLFIYLICLVQSKQILSQIGLNFPLKLRLHIFANLSTQSKGKNVACKNVALEKNPARHQIMVVAIMRV